MSKIYRPHISGKVLETQNWQDLEMVKNGVMITRTLSLQEEDKYRQLKSDGASDSAIWKVLRSNKEELEPPPSKDVGMQIELTIPLQELTKKQLILLFNKYAGYELPSMRSMIKDDIIKLIGTLSTSDIVKINIPK